MTPKASRSAGVLGGALRSFVVLLATFAPACASPTSGEDTASSESNLTRSVVTYGFTSVAPLGYLQGLALGPSRDGAMLLAENYTPTGNVTTPNLWDGTKLSAIPSGPFYASGTFAYDATAGATYFLQYSGKAPSQYESLFRYDAGGFRQLYSSRFSGAYATLVYDSTRHVLLRVATGAVQRFDAAQSTPSSPRWSDDGPGPDPSYDPQSATFDEKKVTSVIAPPQPASSTGGAVGRCSVAAYDSVHERVVGICMTTSRGARIVEWDGQTLQVGALENGDRLWGPKTFAFDRARGTFVAADPDRFYAVTRTVHTVPNGVPALSSATSAQIYATEEAAVPVVATDADLDPVTVTLVDPPQGARLDGNMLRWTPSVADEGKRVVHVRLTDGESTVERAIELDVKVLRYTTLPGGTVAVTKDFWMSGPGTLRGRTRNTHGEVKCALTGQNPGVVRASCGVTAEICGDSPSGTAPCSVAWARALGASSVVAESGSFGESRSQSRTCTQCGRWSSNVSGSVTPDKGVCVSYRYDTEVFVNGILGTAQSSASGCSGP
jgi:hypothetical protein